MAEKIKARIFFEVMGWPAEALTNHLKTVVEKLKKTWKISNENYAEPVPVDEKEPKILTTHVEFEAIIPSFHDLVVFSLLYGPSVVEIIEPPEIYLTAGEIQDILADIISKVQAMDRDIKLLASQNKILNEKLKSLTPSESSEKEDKDKEVKI